LELVEKLLEKKPELAVILSSGYTGEKSNWDKIQSKGYRFIKKPFAITELLYAIYQGLGKK
jgi:DNA-binding NtrC family response regulator